MHKRCKSIIGLLCFSLICANTPMVYASNSIDAISVSSVKEVKVGEETISAPMLATISTLAVASGITLSGDDDIYDMGRLFHDYVILNDELTWDTVVSIFESSVAFNTTSYQLTVGSEFGLIVKGFFDTLSPSQSINSEFPTNVISGTLFGLPVIDYGHSISSTQKYYSEYHPGLDLSKYKGDYTVGDVVIKYRTDKTWQYWDITFPNNYSMTIFSIKDNIYPLYLFINYYTEYNTYRPFVYKSYNGWGYYAFDMQGGKNFTTNSAISIPMGNYNPGNVWGDTEEGIKDVPIYVPGDLSDLLTASVDDILGDTAPSWVGDGTFTLPEVENPSINVDTSAAFLPEGCYKTPVVLNQEATILDVTVPLSFPVSVDSEGVVTVADNVEVVNNSIGPIQISDISIQSKDDWALSDFDKDYSAERVGLKEFSFKIEGQEISDSITLNKVVNGLDKCSIDYDSRVAPQKDSISDSNIADIVLTIDWYEN